MTVLDLVWWAAIGLLVLLSVTQWLGFDGSKPVAILQSLSLYTLACAAPLGVLAAVDGRWVVAALCLAPLTTLARLTIPVGRARSGPGDAPSFTVAFGNLLSRNRHPADAVEAMATTEADVLVMVEYTPEMHAALQTLAGCAYPYRVEDVRPNPAGIAVWSRIPMTGCVVSIVGRPSVDVSLEVDGRSVRVLAIHTTPPTMRARRWRDELRSIGDAAATTGGGPTLLIGDFNAARWHPSFRALLRRGWRSGHEMLGRGWTASWPTRGYPAPPFVRLDHALVDHHLAPVDVREVDIPGSDHRAFVMSFAFSER